MNFYVKWRLRFVVYDFYQDGVRQLLRLIQIFNGFSSLGDAALEICLPSAFAHDDHLYNMAANGEENTTL
jgi:hypothetical protein